MENNSSRSDKEEDIPPSKFNNYKKLLDSESEEDTTNVSTKLELEGIQNTPDKLSDSDDESAQKASEVKNRRKNINPKKRVLQRKSVSKAMDTIKENMTKQQTKLKQKPKKQIIEREQDIHVPYHKPKQYSLKEFLARRTLKKPLIEKTDGKPVSTIMSIKIATANIQEFVQKMKEREDEAIEFFRSESESDDDEIKKDVPSDNIVEATEEIFVKPTEFTVAETLNSKSNPEEPEMETVKETEKLVYDNDDQLKLMSNEKENLQRLDSGTALKWADQELQRLREKYNNVPLIDEYEANRPILTLKTLEEMKSKDAIIDLETGLIQERKLSGPEILFQRYLKTVQKPKPKSSVNLNIQSFENGKFEQQTVKVKLEKNEELDHNRPGFSHEQLKKTLRSEIVLKRLEEIKTKTLEIEPEEKKIEEACCELLDEEVVDKEEYDKESSDEESEDSSDDDNTEISTNEKNPKKRVLKAFEDSDDEVKEEQCLPKDTDKHANIYNSEPATTDGKCSLKFPRLDHEEFTNDNIDPFATQTQHKELESLSFQHSNFIQPNDSGITKTSDIELLCDPGPSQIAEEDLFDICSGQFAVTQADEHQTASEEVNDVVQDSAQFVSQDESLQAVDNKPLLIENSRKLLESSDEETEEVLQENVKEKQKRKNIRKKVKRLKFSDDEESAGEEATYFKGSSEIEECDQEEEEEEEVEDVLVDYDSEENEIEVKMKKKDHIKAAEKYFEQEAELSESEWGSADEDEKDLNKYDIELGDEDKFDQNQLQEEVGRIHARKILDDDIRNVKKIEDLLFIDEENDGVGRERQFRWKNQTEAFSLEDENARFGGTHNEDGESDEESEIMWRKMRHERDTILSEKSEKMTESTTMSEEILLLDPNSQKVISSNTNFLLKRKFRIIKTSDAVGISPNNVHGTNVNSPFLIKTSNLKNFHHSSFLHRDEKTLNKIASFVSHKDDEVTNLSSHGSNSMSFMTIDKPNDSKKRKSDGASPQEPPKKRKVMAQSLLDQLK